jgi:hypothetical protein
MALVAYAGIGMAALSPDLSLGDPNFSLLLFIWIAATLFLLFRLLAEPRSATAWIRTLRLLGAVLVIAALVPMVLAVLGKGLLERKSAAVNCGNQLRYVVMHSGGFGSTWFDVIEMKRVLPMVYTTRALKQYERETVMDLRCLSGSGVEVRLSEYGKPERIETLGQQ